jgi:hypothetical protein
MKISTKYDGLLSFVDAFVPAFRSVKIGLDVRSKFKIEEGYSYQIDAADILSPSVKELAISNTAIILLRRSRPALFMNEVAMLHKFQNNEGIPLVRISIL